MNVILLGAGRGARLMPLTATEPKCFANVAGRRVLDWMLDAFRENGLDQFVFVGGYLKDVVRSAYPALTVVHNSDWPDTNMLFSLLAAREHLEGGFYSTYTDTLFLGDAVELLKSSPYDITLVMDTLWRQRYRFRSQHPEADGEKMIANGDLVSHISRNIVSEDASGEFTGVLKMTATGAAQFLEFFDGLHASLGTDGVIADGRPFRMAYLIHQFDRMIQSGINVHCVAVPGQYHEIDTFEDYELACKEWARLPRR